VKMFLFVRPLCVSLSPTTVSLTAFTLWCVVQRDPFFCLRTTCANETLMALPLAYLTQQPSREGARFGATSIDATSTAIDRCKSHPPILLMALLLLGRGDGWSAQKQSCRPGQRRRPVHACAKHAVRTTQSGGAPGWPGEQSSCTHTHTHVSLDHTHGLPVRARGLAADELISTQAHQHAVYMLAPYTRSTEATTVSGGSGAGEGGGARLSHSSAPALCRRIPPTRC
jgi:hypothetical protein